MVAGSAAASDENSKAAKKTKARIIVFLLPVRQVWQTQIRLGVELFGDLAHCVLRASDPVHGLRVITQPETAPTSNPAESEKQHAASLTASRTQHPKPATTKACRRFCVAHLRGQLAVSDVGDAGSVRLYR